MQTILCIFFWTPRKIVLYLYPAYPCIRVRYGMFTAGTVQPEIEGVLWFREEDEKKEIEEKKGFQCKSAREKAKVEESKLNLRNSGIPDVKV